MKNERVEKSWDLRIKDHEKGFLSEKIRRHTTREKVTTIAQIAFLA